MNPQRDLEGAAPNPRLRRAAVFGFSTLTLAVLATQAQVLLSENGFTKSEALWLALFIVCIGWLSLCFWTQMMGFLSMAFGLRTSGLQWPSAEEAAQPLSSRTAILVPVYNEDAVQVFANVRAMLESLDLTVHASSFDVFVLSDSTDLDAWVAEEREWAAINREFGGGRVFYRKRANNEAKKAGNIADFCRRWGKRYDFMVVLDADSLMVGKTLVTMARLMEKNAGAGIIQAPPVAVGARTLFARLQQFAGRMYGGMNASGLAFWQVGDANYWGHNAIIRVRAFMEHCGLPVLPGRAPFGGHILSHDFVEAALIRRGGYSVWLVPELEGSYEQLPPTLLDYAARDRRWCQGNLQHFPLVFARGLHWLSRVHFASGVMAYLSSPLCLLFLVAGGWLWLKEQMVEPRYFYVAERTLFPQWRRYNDELAIQLGVASVVLLLLPKLLSLGLHLIRRRSARGFGGVVRATLSVVLETVWSTLVAPSMMLFQSTFVVGTLLGYKVEWNAQNRGDRRLTWEEAIDRQGWHLVFGATLFALTYALAPGLLPWAAPMLAGLILSVAISVFSSSAPLGRRLARLGLFLTPEEREAPSVVKRARELARERGRDTEAVERDALTAVLNDPEVNALHVALLAHDSTGTTNRVASERAKEKILSGSTKEVTPEERRALLHDAQTLFELHLKAVGA